MNNEDNQTEAQKPDTVNLVDKYADLPTEAPAETLPEGSEAVMDQASKDFGEGLGAAMEMLVANSRQVSAFTQRANEMAARAQNRWLAGVPYSGVTNDEDRLLRAAYYATEQARKVTVIRARVQAGAMSAADELHDALADAARVAGNLIDSIDEMIAEGTESL